MMKLFHDPQEVIEVDDYYRSESDKEEVTKVEKIGKIPINEDVRVEDF